MLRYERRTRAPADVVWALVARPANWSRWAPHVRGADGPGAPEAEPVS
ncbi:MAG: SRPBCC family protein [Solirubrobacteraceae bacterium]